MEDRNEAAADPGGAFHSGRLAAFVVPLLLGLVLFGGIAIRDYVEIYPISNWAMFSRVPSNFTMYTLLLHEVNGKPLNPPQVVTSVNTFEKNFAKGSTFRLMGKFGGAVNRASRGAPGAYEAMLEVRPALEALFGRHKVKYELIHLMGNPLKLHRGEAAREEMSFGTFVSGTPVAEQDMKQHASITRPPKAYAL
jgi:hypothetical protein